MRCAVRCGLAESAMSCVCVYDCVRVRLLEIVPFHGVMSSRVIDLVQVAHNGSARCWASC